ncbi:hypothetical protein CcrSwift_gp144 [Caulobacter phage CcrSwift]|uniref:Uncharacterized protein n=1 Tax=Caulobacter phage CcrSwift TaxID=2927984 RepID=K4K779_9CAUD|nr:hypothetical protein D870_gp277 [Caulobacter phage CcrSwift]AFU88462.1 hypothetical protein CcrSwift_gp144 [Caulobacter phage CcrSwift]
MSEAGRLEPDDLGGLAALPDDLHEAFGDELAIQPVERGGLGPAFVPGLLAPARLAVLRLPSVGHLDPGLEVLARQLAAGEGLIEHRHGLGRVLLPRGLQIGRLLLGRQGFDGVLFGGRRGHENLQARECHP